MTFPVAGRPRDLWLTLFLADAMKYDPTIKVRRRAALTSAAAPADN
jgi:hypothetical protein